MKKSKPEPVPVMDYRQYRRARRLVHECCNYDGGHCIALDDGEECVCVQSISYSLLCRWFRAAVLPLDRELETALFHRLDAKRCAVCGALFTPGSNRAKYCPESLNYLLLLAAFVGELMITLIVSRGYTRNNLYQIVKGSE